MQRSFKTIYYLNFGAPSRFPTLQIAKCYAAAGCRCLQLDLPSHNPYLENDFIKARMGESLAECNDLTVYLNALKELCRALPEVQLELTVYEDTLRKIGVAEFIHFCHSVRISHLACLPLEGGDCTELQQELSAGGLNLLEAIPFDLPAERVTAAVTAGRTIQLMTMSKNPPRSGCETLEEALIWLRQQGGEELYVTMGIRTPERLAEVRRAGADGAYIGSCLMDAWGDEPELSRRIAAFEAAAFSEEA